MNDQSPLRARGSLVERAAELYGFGLGAAIPAAPQPAPRAEPEVSAARTAAPAAPADAPPAAAAPAAPVSVVEAPALGAPAGGAPPGPEIAPAAPRVSRPAPGNPSNRYAKIDRDKLRAGGFMEPDLPGGALAEELRIVKRQLLRGTVGATDRARNILVCSAQPDEGKTFCALNLALSLAAEKDVEVLLVDADFPKPEILSLLGIETAPGLVDALADPMADPESFVIRTDVRGLSVLPAGRHVADVTELLASERTRDLLARLAHPRRIILFDSPPALMASPASVLAGHVGQLLMVVRADRTTEADLREAVSLLSACDEIRLLLNGTAFATNGRRFGSYYGYGQ
jgi:exopolysaccharide/PEP-CTERM locus tyrosine autokinase